MLMIFKQSKSSMNGQKRVSKLLFAKDIFQDQSKQINIVNVLSSNGLRKKGWRVDKFNIYIQLTTDFWSHEIA